MLGKVALLVTLAGATPALGQLDRIAINLPVGDGGPSCQIRAQKIQTQNSILEVAGQVILECSDLFARMQRARIDMNPVTDQGRLGLQVTGTQTAPWPGATGGMEFTRGQWVVYSDQVECMGTSATACLDIEVADVRRSAPDFALSDSMGHEVRLSALKGRVVSLDFWATWCTGCRVQIPWFKELEAKYQGQGLTTVGVALDEEGWARVRPYVESAAINYTIVVGTSKVAGEYGVIGLPVTLLIDREGRIASTHVGVVDRAAWEAQILVLLGERVLK